MKFKIEVSGEAALGLKEQDFLLEAADGTEASNTARADLAKLMPPRGGKLDIVVSCLEEWTRTVKKPKGGAIVETFPPGVVSEFSVEFEPHVSVRAEVEAERAEAELAALEESKRSAMRLEILGEMVSKGEITKEQLKRAVGEEVAK